MNGARATGGEDPVLHRAHAEVAGVEDPTAQEIIKGHRLQIDGLASDVDNNGKAIETQGRRISENKARITQLGVDMDTHRDHYDARTTSLGEDINTNAGAIDSLNANMDYVKDVQKGHKHEMRVNWGRIS